MAEPTSDKANTTLHGYGMSPGLALGKAFVYQDIVERDHERYEIEKDRVEGEYARIERAFEYVLEDLGLSADRVEEELDAGHAAIFHAHRSMLGAPSLREELRKELEAELVNAEHVVQRVFQRHIRAFRRMTDQAFRSRADDVMDLGRRLLRRLVGIHAHTLEDIPSGSVLVARRLLPSDTVHLSRNATVAVVVAYGGPASHSALLTREMGIPAVGQLADEIEAITANDVVLVNGSSGRVVVAPDDEAIGRFEKERAKSVARQDRARKRCRERATTPSGIPVSVLANIGCQEDALVAAENGADGVGLCRIEYLYLSRQTPPSGEELQEELRPSIERFSCKSFTVRLLDAGADKDVPSLNLPAEPDPALGRRGVRLLIEYPDLLDTQLTALIQLGRKYDIRILVPMITMAEEMQEVRRALGRAAAELGVKAAPPLGAMIETPAAALCVADIVKHADFLSVGTNDLTQYALAAGRENPLVSDYFVDDHPAILRLLRMIAGDAGDRPVEVCGELAANDEALPTLVDMGFRALSVAPARVPALKEGIRSLEA